MGALKKAGVWLGLIEDEDEPFEEPAPVERSRRRSGLLSHEGYFDDDRPGTADRPTERVMLRRPAERPATSSARPVAGEPRATVRPITRDTTVTHGVDGNLALAPEPQQPTHLPGPLQEPERRYHITTLHPTTYREARTIGEHFRDGTPVIMNLTEMDEADARRLVDFGAGLAFGLRGNMERVTNRVFLLSPANVHVTAEDKAKIAEGGFFQHR
jgi:cell division inhibitor SepF